MEGKPPILETSGVAYITGALFFGAVDEFNHRMAEMPQYDLSLIHIYIDLGYVKLERNILGRYKIVHLGYGGGSFRDGVVRSGEKAL